MQQSKYTASVYYNNELLDRQTGDDYSQIMARLLNKIEISCTSTYGTIKDNSCGRVVHRCRKTTIE